MEVVKDNDSEKKMDEVKVDIDKYERNDNEYEINIFNKTEFINNMTDSEKSHAKNSNIGTIARNIVIEEEKVERVKQLEISYNSHNEVDNKKEVENKEYEHQEDDQIKLNNKIKNFESSRENEIILLFFINPDCGSTDGKKILNMGVSKLFLIETIYWY